MIKSYIKLKRNILKLNLTNNNQKQIDFKQPVKFLLSKSSDSHVSIIQIIY